MVKPIFVLAIDDEQNILSTLERHFIMEPYRLVTTTSVNSAWECLSREPIKVVISDQRMPGVSGVEFLKQVKEKYPDVIRILLTGQTDMQAAEQAVNVGQVYRFLSKPWNMEDIRATVRKAIEAFDLAVENRRLFEEALQMNVALKKLYEKQKEFTSTVSHELRTPLASIKMGLDIVLSGTSGPLSGDQSDILGMARADVDRLNRLINDILDLSKIESGKITMKIKPDDLNQVVRESLEPQRKVAEGKGLKLECVFDHQLPLVMFDKDRMLQVLYNLVGNAIKFTDQGGVKVEVKGDVQGNSATVVVEDSGPGISQEDIPKLFEKFQQLEGAVNHKVGGTGLGLAICKTIIESHAGKIWVESALGKGSRFCCLIPIVDRRKG